MKTEDMLECVVSVDEECISNGTRINIYYCPVALAVNKVLKYGLRAEVGSGIRIRSLRGNFFVNYPVPPEAREFIQSFDRHQSVDPFQFKLNIPKDLVK